MNTAENPNPGPSQRASIPGWAALIVALIFWVTLLPLVHAGIPWPYHFSTLAMDGQVDILLRCKE